MNRLSLRVRLAGLIGLTLVVCGAALLAISYGLVSSNLNVPGPAKAGTAVHGPTTGASHVVRSVRPGASRVTHPTAAVDPKGEAQRALRRRTLDQLVTQYLAVFAGVLLVAIALGWLLAGRLLRSVRRITRVAQRVTGRNLTERIGLEGPRDELRELADAFDGMLARLDAVFRAQRRFVADASHELRTPLAAMRAELEVLAADPHATTADVEASTLVLRRQLARSGELIEALLALARSEPELLVLENVDLAQIAREALEEAAARICARRLSVEHQLAPAVVHGDRRLLMLLVGNLLDNVISHNHDGGWIRLQTTVEADRGLLAIANSGHEVAASEVHELTQAFRRGGRARVGAGHGLGLAIVQAVARAHQGTLTIERGGEGGLSIEVRLPQGVGAASNGLSRVHDNGAVTRSPLTRRIPAASHESFSDRSGPA